MKNTTKFTAFLATLFVATFSTATLAFTAVNNDGATNNPVTVPEVILVDNKAVSDELASLKGQLEVLNETATDETETKTDAEVEAVTPTSEPTNLPSDTTSDDNGGLDATNAVASVAVDNGISNVSTVDAVSPVVDASNSVTPVPVTETPAEPQTAPETTTDANGTTFDYDAGAGLWVSSEVDANGIYRNNAPIEFDTPQGTHFSTADAQPINGDTTQLDDGLYTYDEKEKGWIKTQTPTNDISDATPTAQEVQEAKDNGTLPADAYDF